MSEFINTADVIGDDEMCDQIIMRTVTEYKENRISHVGRYAFYNCTDLTKVDLPNADTIGIYAFHGCTALTEVDLPNATLVSDFAFQNCAYLSEISLPMVQTIGVHSFDNSGISKIYAPNAAGTIGATAFLNCRSLTKVCFPLVTAVNDSAFRWAGLRVADFTNLTKTQGNWVFQCSSLEAFVIRNESSVCTLGSANHFTDTKIASGTGYIYVPRSLVDSYKAASNWSTYAAQFRALEDYTVDGTITGDLDESKI